MQPLMKCARCGLVEYCSRECQKQHWKTGGHKLHCVTEQERSVSSSHGSKPPVDENALVCPCCREPFFSSSTSSPMVTLRCRHIVHKSCLESMLSFGIQRTCPLCRAELPAGDVFSWEASCANCSVSTRPDNSPLQHCGRCKSVWYCGRECQKKHWKLGRHKELCDMFCATVRCNINVCAHFLRCLTLCSKLCIQLRQQSTGFFLTNDESVVAECEPTHAPTGILFLTSFIPGILLSSRSFYL
jgi:hypothetical protein